MNICIILLSVFNSLFNQPPVEFKPDYHRTVDNIYTHIGEFAKDHLKKFLAGQSLNRLVDEMTRATRDTIDKYASPVYDLRLESAYTLEQFDETLKPHHLGILDAIKRFEARLLDKHLPRSQRFVALQVLIGLNTALCFPLNITQKLTRQDFINYQDTNSTDSYHTYLDFINNKISNIARLLYRGYDLGVRVRQAQDNEAMINSFFEQGYRNAALQFGYVLSGASIGRQDPPDYFILEPNTEPVYSDHFVRSNYPGGWRNLDRFLFQNLDYPKDEWELGMEEICSFRFVVEKDGSLSHIRGYLGFTPGIKTEALRVMRMSGKWLPARLQDTGKLVRSYNRVSIKFKIEPGVKREDAFKRRLTLLKIENY